MRGAAPRKAQKTKSAQYEDLAKLGKYLGASDIKGTDRTRKAESKRREAALVDQYRANVGGGQGKAKRTMPKKAAASKGSASKPAFNKTNTGTWNVSARGRRSSGK